MNTTKGNELIAEFMGFEKEQTLDGITVYAIPISRNNPTKINDIATEFFETEELRYHLSWDWLMEVVEKISKLPDIYEQESFLLIRDELCTGRIRTTHEAVVNFIEDYNKNK